MSDSLKVLHWIFAEGPTLFGVALAIGGGIALALAPQTRNIRLAHWFFALAWLWAFGGLIEGAGDMKQSVARYAIAFLGTGLIGVFSLATYTWVERNHREAPMESPGDAAANVSLTLTCDIVSLPMSYQGEIWILDTISFDGIGKLSHPKGAMWPQEDVHGTGYRCTVKNYGTATAFDISIVADADVQAWVPGPQPSSWQPGKTISTHQVALPIPQPLGQNGTDSFSFYICSYNTEASISIHLPSKAWINSDDPKNRQEVPLRVVSPLGASLSVPAKLINVPQKKSKRRKP